MRKSPERAILCTAAIIDKRTFLEHDGAWFMLELLLQNFLKKEVNPERDIVTQASDTQKRMQEILTDKLTQGEDLPSLLNDENFLFGSAIRGTQPAPFDDIDMMLVLDGSLLHAIEGGLTVGTAYGSGKNSNVLLTAPYLDANGLISSQKILNRIRSVLAETYSRSEIRKDGQAINVWMDSYGFGIDVVPAFKISSPTRGDHYYIPFGTGSDMWQATNPHADLLAFEAADPQLNGVLRPTAKLMRKWNELSNANRLSGFHVDALVYRSLVGKDIRTLRSAVSTCLGAFDSLLASVCLQFSGFQPHICHKLSEEDRRKSIEATQRARGAITSAATSGLLGVSPQTLDAWDGIFGGKLR